MMFGTLGVLNVKVHGNRLQSYRSVTATFNRMEQNMDIHCGSQKAS